MQKDYVQIRKSIQHLLWYIRIRMETEISHFIVTRERIWCWIKKRFVKTLSKKRQFCFDKKNICFYFIAARERVWKIISAICWYHKMKQLTCIFICAILMRILKDKERVFSKQLFWITPFGVQAIRTAGFTVADGNFGCLIDWVRSSNFISWFFW